MRSLLAIVLVGVATAGGCSRIVTPTFPDAGSAPDADADAAPSIDVRPDEGAHTPDLRGDLTATDAARDFGRDQDADAERDMEPEARGLPYPARDAYRIKAIQPDFWSPREDLVGNNLGGIVINLVWAAWEPQLDESAPCNSSTRERYDGHCFQIDAKVDEAIRAYSDAGVVVTAVVYGVPAWARQSIGCSPADAGFEIFCAPDDPSDFARFAGYISRRYDGTRGNGRIADFVIHNEVNSNTWFDVGCGQGVPCDRTAWVREYAENYISAYDQIRKHQDEAKVLISLDHHFDRAFDRPDQREPLLSGKSIIEGVANLAGAREWQVAFHPYPPDLLSPQFGALDLPRVTYGNIGALVGWLRQRYPADPHAWRVMLTESGVNSLGPGSSEDAQADAVCESFRNVLGTPWIENYAYHRMQDHPAETAAGLGVGLARDDGTLKPAWSVWALANRNDLAPPQLDCGFENLPYTILTRSFDGDRGHRASSRTPPPGFADEFSWRLLREAAPGTVALFECEVAQHSLVTRDPMCEGQVPLGPVGFIWETPGDDRVPLYRCRTGSDHFVSEDPNCEGTTTEQMLGWALPPGDP